MESLVFALLIPAAVFGHPVLQVIVWRSFSGIWWYLGVLPLILMGPVLLVTLYLFNAESNLWPIVLIFTSMAASAYLLLLMGIRWVLREMTD